MLKKLYRARITALEMANDRGYAVDEREMRMPFERFVSKYEEKLKKSFSCLNLMLAKRSNLGETMLVYFETEDTLRSAESSKIVKLIEESQVKRCVIVVRNKISPIAKKSLLGRTDVKIEIFMLREMLINITKHELVPKHIPLSKEEVDALLKKYNLKIHQLPKIKVTDPVIRYLGLEEGQVVKIRRKSETAGWSIYYRYVF